VVNAALRELVDEETSAALKEQSRARTIITDGTLIESNYSVR
jgi:hypothetical protein